MLYKNKTNKFVCFKLAKIKTLYIIGKFFTILLIQKSMMTKPLDLSNSFFVGKKNQKTLLW